MVLAPGLVFGLGLGLYRSLKIYLGLDPALHIRLHLVITLGLVVNLFPGLLQEKIHYDLSN